VLVTHRVPPSVDVHVIPRETREETSRSGLEGRAERAEGLGEDPRDVHL